MHLWPRRLGAPLITTLAALAFSALFSARFANESPHSPAEFVSPEAKAPPVLPWQPLSDPPTSHVRVAGVVDDKNRGERLASLEALADDPAEDGVARGLAQVAAGRELLRDKKISAAIERLGSEAVENTALAPYAGFWIARELAKSDPVVAVSQLDRVVRMGEFGQRAEAVLLYSDLLSQRGDVARAAQWVAEMAESAVEEDRARALDRLGDLYLQLGRDQDAISALQKLYFGMPTQKLSSKAGKRLAALHKQGDPLVPESELRRYLARAQRLGDMGQHSASQQQYREIAQKFKGLVDAHEMTLKQGVALYRRRRFSAARQQLSKVAGALWKPEAEFYLAEIDRRTRRTKAFQAKASALLEAYPDNPWAEETLFSLFRFHRGQDDPQLAAKYLQELLTRFPRGKNFLEAQWAYLWQKYRDGEYRFVATEAEKTAREHPGTFEISRFLYYSGRSYERAGLTGNAESLYHQVLLGFQNTYYGRRAYERLSVIQGPEALAVVDEARRGIDLGDAFAVRRKEQQLRVAQLVTIGLFDQAFDEAEDALRGEPDDPAFMAIAAWLHASRRDNLSAIIAIRDAFPFHISATGQLMPTEIWKVFYPMPFQDSLFKYARERDLDPFLVAGLVRQESTFNPRVRSRAGARGLMQIMPATGKQLARQEGRSYRLAELYDPEVNMRYGTRYLKDLIDRFDGRIDYALAGYNAGPHRVRRWTGMDMAIDPEVFIEEIPFTETRNYVKLVLRNEMVYRRLYGTSLDRAALVGAPGP